MKRVWIVAGLLAAVGGLVWLLARDPSVARGFVAAARWMRSQGALGIAIFAAVYIAATLLFVPHSATTIPAGFAWGFWGGLAISVPVSFASAWIAFFLARHVMRERVERRYKDNEKFHAIDQAVRKRGLLVIILIRIAPLLPFAAINYLLAMTAVSRRDYLVGSAVGMLPFTILYVYLGKAATNVVALLEGKETSHWSIWGLVIGVVAAIVVSVIIQRLAHRALEGKLGR
jgi:uncharacterized membrane protein YdjX (TVP38/TMEM64 family)